MKILLVLCACLMLVGCAPTMTNCEKAQFGYTLSIAMLDKIATDSSAKEYWEAYKGGAQAALEAFCTE